MTRFPLPLTSPRVALALIGALGLCALAGAFNVREVSRELFESAAFGVLAGLLGLSLLAFIIHRIAVTRSVTAAGALLFHGAILLLMLGAGYNRIMSSERLVEVIEGQTMAVPGSPFALRLHDVRPFHRSGAWVKGEAADVELLRWGRPVVRQLVHVNNPLTYGDARVFLNRHGFAPLIRAARDDGRGVFEGYVSLGTRLEPRVYYWRDFRPPGSPVRISALFRPSPDGPYPRDPRLEVVLHDGAGRTLGAGEVGSGEAASVAGHEVSFSDVRYWARFNVRRDPGLGVIYVSFFLGIAGAAMGLLPRVFS